MLRQRKASTTAWSMALDACAETARPGIEKFAAAERNKSAAEARKVRERSSAVMAQILPLDCVAAPDRETSPRLGSIRLAFTPAADRASSTRRRPRPLGRRGVP